MEWIAAQRARRNEVSRSSPAQRLHPSPQRHRLIRQSHSSPIRASAPAQPRPSVPGSKQSNAHHQSSPGPVPVDWSPSRHSRANSSHSDEENYPPKSHEDIYESEELDEDPQISRRPRGVQPTTLVSQPNRDDDEDDFLPAPVLSRPIPDLPGDDDEALVRRRPVINQQPGPALGPRRVTLTIKAMNVPQKRVLCCHMGTQSILMIFLPDS